MIDNHAGNGGDGNMAETPGITGGGGGWGGSGGGVSVYSGSLTISHSLFSENGSGNGGSGGNGTDGSAGSAGGNGGFARWGGSGGAIYIGTGTLTITNTDFVEIISPVMVDTEAEVAQVALRRHQVEMVGRVEVVERPEAVVMGALSLPGLHSHRKQYVVQGVRRNRWRGWQRGPGGAGAIGGPAGNTGGNGGNGGKGGYSYVRRWWWSNCLPWTALRGQRLHIYRKWNWSSRIAGNAWIGGIGGNGGDAVVAGPGGLEVAGGIGGNSSRGRHRGRRWCDPALGTRAQPR